MKRKRKTTFTRVGAVEGRSTVHVEVPKHDEAPVGVAVPVPASSGAPGPRIAGRFATREQAQAAGRLGGLAKAENNANRWARSLGMGPLLQGLEVDKRIVPFTKDADAWYRAQVQYVASTVGGGVCSPGVCSVIRTSAFERCFSAFLFECASSSAFAWDRDDKRVQKVLPATDLVMVAARLGDSSRQNLLAAHSLAALEARSRAERQDAGDDAPAGFAFITEDEGT